MSTAYVALGSNLQSPAAQIRQAMDELDALAGTRVLRRSSLYHSPPVGYADQPDFINAAVALDTTLTPQDLLAQLLALEQRHGRERPFPNAPRPLDLDLLLYDDLQLAGSTLQLPHPRMHERAFVLLPLAEIAPDLVIPGTSQTVAALARACPRQGVSKL